MPHNISHLRNNSNGDFENHRKHIIPKRKRINRAVYEKFKDDTIKGISGEIPFEISDGWAWARWKDISLPVQYGYSAPARPTGRIKMVRITDIQDNRIIWDSVPYCQIEEMYFVSAIAFLNSSTGMSYSPV